MLVNAAGIADEPGDARILLVRANFCQVAVLCAARVAREHGWRMRNQESGTHRRPQLVEFRDASQSARGVRLAGVRDQVGHRDGA